MLDLQTEKMILKMQKNEITEYMIYKKLAMGMRNEANRKILEQIAEDELKHYNFWQKYTQKNVNSAKIWAWLFYSMSKIFGLTFGLKFMEKGEKLAQVNYQKLAEIFPEAKEIVADEERHEIELLALLKEEKLDYIGSIVLGLNDALVELTGALAGFTFAFSNNRVIAVIGLITGVSAAFSMAASQYLSTQSSQVTNPFKSAIYTGSAYLLTVFLLIAPYLLLSHSYLALIFMLLIVFLIIFFFTFYIAVAKDMSFKKRFLEMIALSVGVSVLTFALGVFMKRYVGVEL